MNADYQYMTCKYLEDMTLGFFERIDSGEKCIKFCCEFMEPEGVPGISFKETAEETLDAYLDLWAKLKTESKQIASGQRDKPEVTVGCAACKLYTKNHWLSDGLIRYIFFSMYPSPCQCHCVYCNLYKDGTTSLPLSDAAKENYEKLFAMIDLCHKRGIIAPDALWAVACGELSIHPYRDRILDLVEGKRVVFHSNCFKFDERIAAHLGKDPKSELSFSIDAGTPEAWEKVKGYNNFTTVVGNLEKYVEQCVYPDQVRVKYIIIPGANDTRDDFEGLMKIMRRLKLTRLPITRDLSSRPEASKEEKEAAALLLAMCFKNGINASSDLWFGGQEKLEIKAMAAKLLQEGMV